MCGMTTVSIDTAGRIVLPAPIRARLGLAAGMSLVLVEEQDGVSLHLPVAAARIRQRDGVPFVQTTNTITDEMIDELRADLRR